MEQKPKIAPGSALSISLKPLAVLDNATSMLEFISEVRQLLGKRVITFNELKIFIEGGHSLFEEDFALKISNTIKSVDEKQAKVIWKKCDRWIKSHVLLPDTICLDIDIFNKLDLDGEFVRKSFFLKKQLARPHDTPYSTTYHMIDQNTGLDLVQVLILLPKSEAIAFIESIHPKVLYLIASHELAFAIEETGASDEIYAALNYDDMLPESMPFVQWVQEHMRDYFYMIAEEIQKYEYKELRDMFYEQITPDLISGNYQKPLESLRNEAADHEGFIDDLLKSE